MSIKFSKNKIIESIDPLDAGAGNCLGPFCRIGESCNIYVQVFFDKKVTEDNIKISKNSPAENEVIEYQILLEEGFSMKGLQSMWQIVIMPNEIPIEYEETKTVNIVVDFNVTLEDGYKIPKRGTTVIVRNC